MTARCKPPWPPSGPACLGAVVLIAQEPQTFRVATRLVELSVVVHDQRGRPVSGLTANDFRVFDGGQEQRIEFFSAVAEGRANVAEVAASAARRARNVHEFRNRISSPDGATVILFDRLNTPAADQVYARKHLINFLRQIERDDRVGIYVLEGSSIRVLHDFTNDASSLVRAVARYDAMTSNEVAATEEPLSSAAETGDAALDSELSEFLARASSEMTRHFTELRSDATMGALEEIANHLAAVRGRKNLIWISSGFPLEGLARGKSMTAATQRATRPLNDANVTLYGVDARGLAGALTFAPRGRPVMTTLSSVHTNLDILQIASEETGGRAFYNTNDISRSVRRAVDDSRVSYVLGYYPGHGKWDGTYRRIKVTVNRSGVDVRHRKGYLAGTGASREAADGAKTIGSALMSLLEATELELTATLERVAGTGNEVKIRITAAPGAIALQPAGDSWEGTVDVVIAQKLADGSAPRSIERRVDLRLDRTRYEDVRTQGFSTDARVALQPGIERLHIVVHDAMTGDTGSIVVDGEKLRSLTRN